MTDLIRTDPFRSLFGWPRWLDDTNDLRSQRGLKIYETDKNIKVEAVVAGIPSEEVEVNIEDGVLTIKAEKKEEESKQDEFRSTTYKYYYTCALSGGEWDKTKAEVDHGVLELTIPKAKASRPQKIKVKTKASK